MNNQPGEISSSVTDQLIDKRYRLAYYHRGRAYKELKDKSQARQSFQQAADLGLEEAKRELKKL